MPASARAADNDVDALRGELSEKDAELRTLQATATTDLWLTDLQALEEQLDIDDAKREAGEADAAKKAKAHASKKGKKVQRGVPVWFFLECHTKHRLRRSIHELYTYEPAAFLGGMVLP